jgi:hypothetical protein
MLCTVKYMADRNAMRAAKYNPHSAIKPMVILPPGYRLRREGEGKGHRAI